MDYFVPLTSQITGGKKQSDEGAALFAVRVHLPCYAIFV
jgi:hypothetical protein